MSWVWVRRALFFWLSVSSFPLFGFTDVEVALEKISEADRKALSHFFQFLMREYPCGYTLFGAKPLSVADFPIDCLQNSGMRVAMMRGWRAWVRNRHLFPSEKFVLKEECLDGIKSIWIIHKKHALDCLMYNSDLFKEKYGNNFDPQQFLDKMCDPQTSLNLLLCHNNLLGTLLGYGRENAILFDRECELQKYISQRSIPPSTLAYLLGQLSKPARRLVEPFLKNSSDDPLSSIQQVTRDKEAACIEEFNTIAEQRGIFELPGQDYELEYFQSPAFVTYNDASDLVNLYQKTRKKMCHAYRNQNFLVATLEQWVTPDE